MEFGPDVAYWKLIFVPSNSTYDSCKLNLVDLSALDTCIRERGKEQDLPLYETVKGYSWPVKYNYVGFTPMRYLKDKQGQRIQYTLWEISSSRILKQCVE